MPEMNMLSRTRMADYNTIQPTNFNENHPEIRDGEVFFMNKPDGEGVGELHEVESYRMGETAYTNCGNTLEGWKPMFVRFK